MAKRFTDTDKFSKQWIRKLPAAYKLLWCYITDACSIAGIWEVDFEIACIKLGVELSAQTALKLFNADELRVVEIDKGAKWFIVPFVGFQYGELKNEVKPHRPVINALLKYDLNKYLKIENKGYSKGINTLKDKDKDKDKEQDKDKEGLLGEKKPYVLRKEPDCQLVYVYKVRSGYAIDDRAWDGDKEKGDFGRHRKTAQKLLAFFEGNIEEASLCIEALADYFVSKKLAWSFEAIERNKADYKRQIKNYGKFYELGYESKKESYNAQA